MQITAKQVFTGMILLGFLLIAACGKSGEEKLLGQWVNAKGSYNDWVKITKRGENYTYEDRDGKYPAVYKDGELKIDAGEFDLEAVAYYQEETKLLILMYRGQEKKFKRVPSLLEVASYGRTSEGDWDKLSGEWVIVNGPEGTQGQRIRLIKNEYGHALDFEDWPELVYYQDGALICGEGIEKAVIFYDKGTGRLTFRAWNYYLAGVLDDGKFTDIAAERER